MNALVSYGPMQAETWGASVSLWWVSFHSLAHLVPWLCQPRARDTLYSTNCIIPIFPIGVKPLEKLNIGFLCWHTPLHSPVNNLLNVSCRPLRDYPFPRHSRGLRTRDMFVPTLSLRRQHGVVGVVVHQLTLVAFHLIPQVRETKNQPFSESLIPDQGTPCIGSQWPTESKLFL